MTKRAVFIVIAAAALTGQSGLIDRERSAAFTRQTSSASNEFPPGPQTDGSVEARRLGDVTALEQFRPGYEFWRAVFTIPDGWIAFGSASDGRLLAAFPANGDWSRRGKWHEPALASLLNGHTLPKSLDDRREYVAKLMRDAVGPVLHNHTRGAFVEARQYGSFLAEWGTIYERFGVPAGIGLAQAMVESGFEGRRRSEADAVGLCQWLERNWDYLDRLDPVVLESGNQTTQAAYCAAYISILATKYGSFIPALSAHHAGDTNVGRVLVTGARLGPDDPRERYFLGSQLVRDLRSMGDAYSEIYGSYGPRSYRYAEMVFGNTATVRSIIDSTAQSRIYAMRTTRSLPLADIVKRAGLTADEVRRFNPALVKTVPRGATLYLPTFDGELGRDVSFWRRPATAGYAAVLDAFVRLDRSPEEWDEPLFQPTLEEFVRRFRATDTEEGNVMATVLTYVRRDSLTSPRRAILAEYANSADILALFARGLHERDMAAALAAD